MCLGRDRAYRRFWILESLPGLYVEHDDDTVGVCLPNPTIINPNSKPIDEATALERVKEILDKKNPEGQGSDKENDEKDSKKDLKTYSKKPPQQKVLSAKNGSIQLTSEEPTSSSTMANGETASEAEIKAEIKAEQQPQSETMEISDKNPNMWGICLADMDNCTVHSTILPKTNWSHIKTIEEIDALIEALNPRGYREGKN